MKRCVACALGALIATGCGSSTPTPTTPTISPPPITIGGIALIGPYTISGAVTEGTQPVAGANVNAFVTTANIGYSYMYAHGQVLTDSAGHFQMPGVPADAVVWFQAWKDGYVQQCASSVVVHGDSTMDLALVSKANLSAATAQPTVAGLRSVSGVILETTSTGKQPVAGAFVDFEPLEDFPAAITYSDALGKFLLCGLPQNEPAFLGASVARRVAYVTVPPGQTTGVEITLPSASSLMLGSRYPFASK